EKQVKFIVNKLRTERSTYNEVYKFDGYVKTNSYFNKEGLRIQEIIITYGGKNGFTKLEAEVIKNWINRFFEELFSKTSYSEIIKKFMAADVRFIVKDEEGLRQLLDPDGKHYTSGPNNFNRSVWGMEIIGYSDNPVFIPWTFIHETARIYCEQTIGPNYSEEQREQIEKELLQIASKIKFP
ncbi:MAG: hypothetical protein NZ528_14425, partial [Caldilineales bacterium]|nr:hypothetical protein [Caldilineales bacterium]